MAMFTHCFPKEALSGQLGETLQAGHRPQSAR